MSSVRLCITLGQQFDVGQTMKKTKSRVDARRCRIIVALARGHPVQEVLEKAGCVHSTVYRALYRFEDAGLLGVPRT